MPLFALYLAKNYFKVLLLSVSSFIAILLVSRLEEIAHFASMGAPLRYVALFILYQIPYILPIALPISCLISALLLFQHLSHTHELTALRAGGLSLKQITAPILLSGALFALLNLYITSELATSSHLATRQIAYSLTSKNPLILLQSAKIANLKGAYVQLDPVHNGEAVENVLIAAKNPSNGRLNLCLAKNVTMEAGDLKGNGVTLVSTVPAEAGEHLILENQTHLSAPAMEFAQLLRKKGWKISPDHLKFNLLRVHERFLRKNGGNPTRCYTEGVRRLSLALAPFTFTLMGVSFGMEISRNRSKKGLIAVVLLTALTLVTFFVGKGYARLFWIATPYFLLPHLLIVGASCWTLSRVNRGVA